jgi:uridine phosphorylase
VPRPPAILKPHEPVAERVLLPGDPGRALRLAQLLITGPRMLNHHRGLWGYSGPASDGELLTVQSTGLGGPSAAAVVAELVAMGARRLVRVGTCAGLGAAGPGTVVVAREVIAGDGASRALGAGARVTPDAALTAALALAAGRTPHAVASADVLDPVLARTWTEAGAVAADLSSAAVLVAAQRAGASAAVVLGVTRAGDETIDDAGLEALEARLGEIAMAAVVAF